MHLSVARVLCLSALQAVQPVNSPDEHSPDKLYYYSLNKFLITKNNGI